MQNIDYKVVVVLTAIIFLQIVVVFASYWKLFSRAGKPGWAAIVPFYNVLIMLQIVRKPWWWVFLICIPFVGLIWGIWTFNLLIKSFGRAEGYTVGSIFFGYIFLPLLAFDKNTQFTPAE